MHTTPLIQWQTLRYIYLFIDWEYLTIALAKGANKYQWGNPFQNFGSRSVEEPHVKCWFQLSGRNSFKIWVST